jgi:hypothetical protein
LRQSPGASKDNFRAALQSWFDQHGECVNVGDMAGGLRESGDGSGQIHPVIHRIFAPLTAHLEVGSMPNCAKLCQTPEIILISKGYWCGREDSNFHGLSPTTTSTLRVYQFRHDRTSKAD